MATKTISKNMNVVLRHISTGNVSLKIGVGAQLTSLRGRVKEVCYLQYTSDRSKLKS